MDEKMIAIEKMVCYSQFLRREGIPLHEGDTPGSTGFVQEAEGGGTCGPKLLLRFLREGTAEAESASLGLARLNIVPRVWGIGTVLALGD